MWRLNTVAGISKYCRISLESCSLKNCLLTLSLHCVLSKASMNISSRCYSTLSMSIKVYLVRQLHSCHTQHFQGYERLITSNLDSPLPFFFAGWVGNDLRILCCRLGDCCLLSRSSQEYAQVKHLSCDTFSPPRNNETHLQRALCHQARSYCFRTRCRKKLGSVFLRPRNEKRTF